MDRGGLSIDMGKRSIIQNLPVVSNPEVMMHGFGILLMASQLCGNAGWTSLQ